MFGLAYNAYKQVRKRQQKAMTVILLGVDNAGKSTLLHTLRRATADSGRRRAGGRLRLPGRRRSAAGVGVASGAEEAFAPTPTIGFEEQSLDLAGQRCTVYDLGGSRMGRTLWPSYLDEVHGVIFVVDAADAARLGEVKEVLHATLAADVLVGKPVLILCNKQDVPGALAPAQVAEALALHELASSAHQLFAVTARDVEDARMFKGLKWLGGAVSSDYAALHARIERDVADKKRRQEAERAERKRRIEERKAQRERERAEQAAREGQGPEEPMPPAQPGPPAASGPGRGAADGGGASGGASGASGVVAAAAAAPIAAAARPPPEVELAERQAAGADEQADEMPPAVAEPAAAPRQGALLSGDPAAPLTPGGSAAAPGGAGGGGQVPLLPNQIFRTASPEHGNPLKKLPSLGHTPLAPQSA